MTIPSKAKIPKENLKLTLKTALKPANLEKSETKKTSTLICFAHIPDKIKPKVEIPKIQNSSSFSNSQNRKANQNSIQLWQKLQNPKINPKIYTKIDFGNPSNLRVIGL